MIYLYAVPRALERYRNAKLRSPVASRDHTVRIPAEAVDDQFVQSLSALILRLSADEPATCAVTAGMPLLRHQRRRLPSTSGRSLRGRKNRRLSTVATDHRAAGFVVLKTRSCPVTPTAPNQPLRGPFYPQRNPAPDPLESLTAAPAQKLKHPWFGSENTVSLTPVCGSPLHRNGFRPPACPRE